MRQPAWRWSLSRRKLFDLARRAGDYKARLPPDVVEVSRSLQPRARNRKAPNLFEDMTKLLDRKIVSTVAPKNRMNGKDDQTRKALLRLVVRRHADRLVVVGRIEFGAVAAPGRVLEYAVDLAEPGRRKPQRDDLSDPHHHIPADDLDAGRRKSFIIALLLELRVEFAQGTRLVVLQEYGEHNGVVGCRRRVFRRRRGRLRQSA